MIEFGSDFHIVDNYFSGKPSLKNIYKDLKLFADGRQCIIALIQEYKWKRIWMPQYFCYEVIESIRTTGVQIAFYLDYPCYEEIKSIKNITFKEGDVLLRVNYFGLRYFRSEKSVPVPVIEDHTHDILGHWALHSDASWCIASLRKSLPLAEGGMLWSPKGYQLNNRYISKKENNDLAETRWMSMRLKMDYLTRKTLDKEIYREIQIKTEELFSNLPVSAIDEKSNKYIDKLDINAWYLSKRENWTVLCNNFSRHIKILQPENDSCNMFSWIVLAETNEERERIKKALIDNLIYPAVLWNVPDTLDEEVVDFSKRMLSIHCDGRYSNEDMQEMSKRLKSVIGND